LKIGNFLILRRHIYVNYRRTNNVQNADEYPQSTAILFTECMQASTQMWLMLSLRILRMLDTPIIWLFSVLVNFIG